MRIHICPNLIALESCLFNIGLNLSQIMLMILIKLRFTHSHNLHLYRNSRAKIIPWSSGCTTFVQPWGIHTIKNILHILVWGLDDLNIMTHLFCKLNFRVRVYLYNAIVILLIWHFWTSNMSYYRGNICINGGSPHMYNYIVNIKFMEFSRIKRG